MGAADDFVARVNREVRRGTKFDADIPTYIFDACQTLDRMHTWVHMWKEVFGETLAADTPTITVPVTAAGLVQSVKYLRFTWPIADEVAAFRYTYASKSMPQQIRVNRVISQPYAVKYWMIDRDTIGMNGTYGLERVYDIGFYEETVWGDDNPWLVIDSRLLLAQTLLEMQNLLRDDALIGRNERVVNRRLASLENSDLLHQYDDAALSMDPFADEMESFGYDSHGSERS